jgi:hypothetical protein
VTSAVTPNSSSSHYLDGRRFNGQRGAKIRGTIANVVLARQPAFNEKGTILCAKERDIKQVAVMSRSSPIRPVAPSHDACDLHEQGRFFMESLRCLE